MIASGPMDLSAYLDRIAFTGDPRPDRATLDALMRAHLLAVSFENLDQQLGRRVTTDLPAAYAKIVDRRRGGWCFELNGLFGWALAEIGFEVDSLAAYVDRDPAAPRPASHKCLRVRCGEPLLVDVGFGGSLLQPLPIRPGEAEQPPYQFAIAEQEDGFLRFTERSEAGASSFDFRLTPVGDRHFDAVSDQLQTDEDSPFRLNLTAQRRFPDRHLVLRGRVLSDIGPDGVNKRVLESADALVACLRDRFGLDVPEVASIWPRIVARHEELFGN